MSYGALIKDAFWLTLRNRYLWFFGFFAAGAGGSANFNVPSGGSSGFDDGDFGGLSSAPGLNLGQWLFDNLALILVIIALVLLIVLIFVVLSLISQGALAESVVAIDRGESRRFSSAFRAGVSNFWRVLGYYLLFILISLGLLLVIGAPVTLLVVGVFTGTESVGAQVIVVVLAVLASVLLLIGVFIPLSIIGQFALRGLVVGREGVIGSIGGGYRLFRQNLGRSLLIWLLQLALSIGAGIALLIVIILLGFILFLPAIILAVTEFITAAIVAGIVAALILLPLLIVASGAFGTFNHSYWTLAYLRLTAPPPPATEPYSSPDLG